MNRTEPAARPTVRPGYWFVPKRIGFGATPATWQGWLATLVFIVALVGAMQLSTDAARIAAAVPMVIGFVVLVWAKTDGGWRWRS